MKKNKSIKLNFIMNVILTMSSFIFPLITFPYVSRILLPEGTGKVSFATSLISYFSMFAQLGIPTYGIRACAKVRDDKEELTRTTQELVIINFVMSVTSYTALAVALMLVPRLREERALYIIVSLTIAFNVIGMEWMYKALEQYTYITIRSIIFKFVALIVMFVFVHQKSDYIFYGAITILAASGSNIFNFINAHKFIDMRPVGKYHFKRHFKPIAVFFAMSCATTIYTHLDTVMLGFMTTDADVGYYNAAVKIKTILVSIVTSLGVVLLPRASYYIEHKMIDEFYRIAHKAINFVFLIALPMMLYFMIFAKEGIFFLSGSAYEKSILPMQVIMPTLLFIGLTNVMGIQMLVPLGKEKIVLYSEIAGAVVDLIVNFDLIPRYASVGAAIGTLAAEIVVWVVQFGALKQDIMPAYKKIQRYSGVRPHKEKINVSKEIINKTRGAEAPYAAQIFTHLSVVNSRQRSYDWLRCEGKIKESKTMTDIEIFQLAEKFRNAILKANANGEFFRDNFIELFPRGNCGIVCDLLGRYLLEYANVRSWYTSGETKSECHVWLTLENGVIVDITGDQYSTRTGTLYYDLPVYAGQIDVFYKQFRLNGEPLEITPNDWTPDLLGETSNQRKKRIAYEKIMKYVD